LLNLVIKGQFSGGSTDDAWWCDVKAPSWEPQEEGMRSTTTSFPQFVKPRFIELIGESQTSDGDAY
jgi:hypothetical protein